MTAPVGSRILHMTTRPPSLVSLSIHLTDLILASPVHLVVRRLAGTTGVLVSPEHQVYLDTHWFTVRRLGVL